MLSNPDAQIVMPVVADDVGFSLRTERLPKAERASGLSRALSRFGSRSRRSTGARPRRPGLAAGADALRRQKQLLALCGAFVRDPDLVVADEPTAYLDARNARLVADHLLADTGHALVLVTHDLDLARRCDAAVLFAEGSVVAAGTASGVVDAYERTLAC